MSRKTTLGGHPYPCHCRPCKDANAAYERHRSRMKAYGRWQPWTDAAPAREHVRRLMAEGLGKYRIAAKAGVARATVDGLLYRGTARMRTPIAAALLAVTLTEDDLPGATPVDSAGTCRRMQALAANGHTDVALAAAVGVAPEHFRAVMRGEMPRVTLTVARQARVVYDRMWKQEPPLATAMQRRSAKRARDRAGANSWPPPLAWDDGDGPHGIDNPAAVPHEWRRARRWRAAELAEEVQDLISQGLSRTQAAERLGVSRDSADAAVKRARAYAEQNAMREAS